LDKNKNLKMGCLPLNPLFQHSLAQTGFLHGTGYYSRVAPGRAIIPWPRPELHGQEFSGRQFRNIMAIAAYSRQVAPGRANIPIVSEAN
jgi:hypothetical protein